MIDSLPEVSVGEIRSDLQGFAKMSPFQAQSLTSRSIPQIVVIMHYDPNRKTE